MLKLGSDDQLVMKLFPRIFKGDAIKWFNALPSNSIDSYKTIARLFVDQYKHNIKE